MADIAVESPKKGEEDITVQQFTTQDEIKAALLSDANLAKEFMDDSDAFIKKYVKSESAQGATDTKAPDAAASVPPPDDEEVVVKFRKKDLGTYAPDGEVIAKGMREKDLTIEFFKKTKAEMEGSLARANAETVSLKKQIEDFKKQQATKPAPAAATITADDIEKLDPLDPDYTKKMASSFKAALDANAQLRAEIDEIKAGLTTVRETVQTRDAAETELRNANNEINELDMIRKLNPDLFKSSRPIAAIEDDYIKAVKGMCAVSGVTDVQANGRFTDQARQVFLKYQDPELGKDLRAACEKQGVKLPDDFSDYQNIWEVKTIRDNNAIRDQATGQYKPIPLDEAVARLKQKSIDPEKIRMEALKAGHDAHAKAVANRQQFAPETKPSEGAPPVDGSKLTLAEVTPMLESYYTLRRDGKLTETDTTKITQVLRAIPGITEADVVNILKG